MITFTWTCFQRSGSLSGNLSVWFCCVCPQKYSTCVFFCSPSGLSDGLRRWEGFKASSYFQSVFLSGHSWLSSPAGGEKKWERRKCQDLFAPSCLWCPLLLGVSSHGRRGQKRCSCFPLLCVHDAQVMTGVPSWMVACVWRLSQSKSHKYLSRKCLLMETMLL